MNNKVRIGFEITDTWTRQEFRELLRLILYNPQLVCGKEDTDFELYIISNDSTSYINAVSNVINSWFPQTIAIDAQHIIVCNFREDKVNACINNNIDIYFDADSLTVTMVDTESANTYPVLVRTEADRYNAKQKYVTDFYNILKNVLSEKESQC